MAIARIQPLPSGSSLIRVWDDDTAEHGEPYQWTIVVIPVGDEIVEAIGQDKSPSHNQVKATLKVLGNVGIKTVIATRVQPDKSVIQREFRTR